MVMTWLEQAKRLAWEELREKTNNRYDALRILLEQGKIVEAEQLKREGK